MDLSFSKKIQVSILMIFQRTNDRHQTKYESEDRCDNH